MYYINKKSLWLKRFNFRTRFHTAHFKPCLDAMSLGQTTAACGPYESEHTINDMPFSYLVLI